MIFYWVVWLSRWLLIHSRTMVETPSLFYRSFHFYRMFLIVSLFLLVDSIDIKCKGFLLQHDIVDLVVNTIQLHLQDAVIVHVCLLFLNVILCDSWPLSWWLLVEQGFLKVLQSERLIPLLQDIQQQYEPRTTKVGTIAKGLYERMSRFKLSPKVSQT